MNYTIQEGDTLYRIALRFKVSLQSIINANSQLKDPNLLIPGQIIKIPTKPELPIVIPKSDYGYDDMRNELNGLIRIFPFLQMTTIGNSEMGLGIPAIKIGEGPREVHYNGSFHANEWITTVLLMKFLELYAKSYQAGRNIGTFHISRLYRETTLWIVPMVNPDGVQLVQGKINPQSEFYQRAIEIKYGSTDFRNWKANIKGVDLNDQFPARWETEVQRRKIPGPAPRDYPGTAPLSESEAQAMASFTREHDFRLVSAFHTQGQEIYWGYRNLEPAESGAIAARLADVSGYRPVKTLESDAGYKDWFIQEFRKPGFTIECGTGINPLPISQFWDIWANVIGIFLMGLDV